MAKKKPNPSWLIWPSLILVILVGVIRAASPPPATLLQSPSRGTLYVEREARGNFTLGGYTVSLTETSMSVIHPQALSDVWKSPTNEGFLSAAIGTADITQTGHLTRVIESWEGEMSEQVITRVDASHPGVLWIYGELRQPQEQGSEKVSWHGRWQVDDDTGNLEVTFLVASSKINRLAFSTMMDPDEHLVGGGVTYHSPDKAMVYAVPRFQGVGRGDHPLTLVEDLLTGQGGSHDTTQAPLARVTTNAPRTQWVKGADPVVMDGRLSGRLSMTSWTNSLTVRFSNGRTAGDQIGQMVKVHGEVHPLPSWLTDGFILTDAGESFDDVMTVVDRWTTAGLKPHAVWLDHLAAQDHQHRLYTALHDRGIRLLVTMPIGTSIYAPDADAVVIEGGERISYSSLREHEISAWVDELLETVGSPGIGPLVFTQSLIPGRNDIPLVAHIGQLNANFSTNDGLATAVPAMVNANISGLPYVDLSIGGDTTIDRPAWLGGVARENELIARSAQLAVFSTFYRTGVDRPAAGVQLSSSLKAQSQLKRWYTLRRALTPIRNRLHLSALRQGLPVIRTTMVVQPDDPGLSGNVPAFYYGNDIYVAPVIVPGQPEMTITLPQGNWRNVFSGEAHLVRRGDQVDVTVPTPEDQFPLFARVDSSADKVLTMWAKHYVPDFRKPSAQD